METANIVDQLVTVECSQTICKAHVINKSIVASYSADDELIEYLGSWSLGLR